MGDWNRHNYQEIQVLKLIFFFFYPGRKYTFLDNREQREAENSTFIEKKLSC